MGRYSLVMETLANEKIPVLLNENGHDKFSLPTIDSFTTALYNDRELLNTIKCHKDKIVNLNVNLDAIKGFKSFKIIYNKDGEHQIPVAYCDKTLLNTLSKRIEASTISLNDRAFNSFVFDFLSMIEKNEFYDFVMSQNIMNYKLTEYITMRREDGDYSDFCLGKIKEHMSNYKQFRDIYFAFVTYKSKDKKVIEDDEEYDPDVDFHPTPDEVEWYKQYQDSFKTEYNCHAKDDDEEFEKPKVKEKRLENPNQLTIFDFYKETDK